ncbi:phage tail tape measure protein [Peptoniphilus sp. HCN-40583]|uniref:phage tail tape measure protein n=1 Tax=Peptoniphilus sp. HCN-40583 TaxID=3134662 RepID=UPI0030C262BD
MAEYNVKAILTANATQLIAGMREAKASVEQFGQATTHIKGDVPAMIGGVGKALTKGVTLPLAAIGGASVKTAANFEAGMSKVQAISGASAADMQRLSDMAKHMGATTKFSASESAEALSYMGMAGWKTDQMIAGLPGVMNLAAASGENLGMVSDIVTDSLTAFGMTANDTGRFVDVLAAAATNSNTNVSLMGETFKYAAPIAGALGYSVEDTALAVGLMANAGIKGSQAGTALRGALTRLEAPTKDVQKGMKMLGLNVKDLQGMTLDQKLQTLRGAFAGLDESQKVQAASLLFGRQAMSGMLAIINASESDYNNLKNAINNSTGAAQKMADVMEDNLKGSLTILKSALEGAGIAIGEILAPKIRVAVDKITELVSAFTNLDPATQNTIVNIGLVVAAIGPVLVIISKVISTFMKAKAAFTAIKDAATILSGAGGLGGLGAAFTKLGGLAKAAFGLIAAHPFVAIAVAAAVAVGLIIANWDKIGPKVKAVWEQVKTSASEAWEGIKADCAAFGEFFTTLWDGIKEGAVQAFTGLKEGIVESWTGLTEALSAVWEGIKAGMVAAWQGIGTAVGEVVGTMKQYIMTTLQNIAPELGGIWDGVKSVTKGAWDFIKNIVIGSALIILQAITGDLSGAADSARQIWNNLKKATQQIWDGMKQIISNELKAMAKVAAQVTTDIKNKVRQAWEGIKNTTQSVWNGIKTAIQTAWNNIKQVVTTAMEAVKTAIKTGWDNAKNAVTNAMNGIKTAVQTGWNNAKQNVKSAIDNIKSTVQSGFSNVVSTVKAKVNEIPGAVKNGFTRAISQAKGACSQAVGVGRQLVNGFVNGVKAAAGRLAAAARSVVAGAIRAAKGALRIHSPSRVFMDIGWYTVKGLAIGLEDNADMAAKAMGKVIDPLTGQEIDIGSNLDRINKQGNAAVDYVVSDKLGERKQSQTVILRLGNRDYKAFIDDITNAQGREIRLAEAYGI